MRNSSILALVVLLVVSSHTLYSASDASPSRNNGTKTSHRLTFEQLSRAANRARDENRDDDAIVLYRQALKLDPDWKEGVWYLSTLLYDKEEYREAQNLLRRFVAYDPQAGPGWALLGMSEFQAREYSRSLDHLQRAMALGMGSRKEMAHSVFYFVSVLLTRFERFDDSMGLLMAMVKSGQQTDSLVDPIGLAALRRPLLPTEIPPYLRETVRTAGLGTLALEAQRQPEAEKLFSAMVTAHPDEPGVHFLYGAFLMDVHPQDGIREMKRELDVSPFNVPARLRLAEEYLKEESITEALTLALGAVRLEAKDGNTHMILGEVLVAEGDLGNGIRELETAREASPQIIRIHWDLLRAYTAARRNDDARREKDEIEKLGHAGAG
jgi:predicted Zn-dependent protease